MYVDVCAKRIPVHRWTVVESVLKSLCDQFYQNVDEFLAEAGTTCECLRLPTSLVLIDYDTEYFIIYAQWRSETCPKFVTPKNLVELSAKTH